MYAGLAGVFLALAFGRIVPESFGFLYSIDFLVMIVLGGLGSVGGAVVGAVIVTALPQVLLHYADRLPLVAPPGGGGLQPERRRPVPLRRRGRRRPDLRLRRARGPGLAGCAGGTNQPQGEHSHESMYTQLVAVGLAVAALLLAAGCGSKGPESSSVRRPAVGSIKTGPGVTDKTITLGVLTDLSGVFAPLAGR